MEKTVKKVIDRGIGDEVFFTRSEIQQDYIDFVYTKIKMQDLMDTTVTELDVDEIDLPEIAV